MTQTSGRTRSLSIPAMLGLLVVYLVVLQGLGLALTSGEPHDYGQFPTTEALVRSTLIPVTIAALLLVGVISWLGWWDRVLIEKLRLGRWAWWFPTLMVVSILIVTDYPLLGDVGLSMTLALGVTALLVGIGEEFMFRGIVLERMRRVGGTTELKAALWTAVIFGGAHITNIFTEGPSAFAQVVAVSIAALYFYVARRVSGGIVIPILIHAGWDFSLFSGDLGVDPEPHKIAIVAMVTNVVLAILLIVKRHDIWPRRVTPPT